VHGFKSFDERDLLGFVDGTENPVGASAPAAALIGDENPSFAGGIYVLVQRYVHDPTSWDALPVAEQERVVGRTKLNDIELAEFGIGRDEVLDRPVAQ
jgi:putative iron-dependent peroxidase